MVVVACKIEEEFYTAIDRAGETRLVVVDCYAEWCGPCIQMAPIFQALSEQYSQVLFIKVDMDKAPAIGKALNVWAMPTFVFMRGGNKISSFMGAREAVLRKGLENDGNVGMCNGACAIQ